MTSFTVTTRTRANCRSMFRAALSPALHAGSMARHQEQAHAMQTILGLHDEVAFTARHFGLTWRMTSRIVEFDADRSFVDEQTSGPFKRFRHTHTFVALEHGCEMTDYVTYRAPVGVIGAVVERLVLTRYLRNLLEQRGHYLASVVDG